MRPNQEKDGKCYSWEWNVGGDKSENTLYVQHSVSLFVSIFRLSETLWSTCQHIAVS